MPLTISHAKSDTIGDGTNTNIVRPIDWNSAHQYTFSAAASEVASLFAAGSGLQVTTGAGGITFGINDASFFEPFFPWNAASSLVSPGIGTWYFDNFQVPRGLDKGRINLFVSNAAGFLNGAVFSATSTGSASKVQTFYDHVAIYQRGTGASTTRLESIWSGACSLLFTQSISVNGTASTAVSVSNYLTASFPAQWGTDGAVTYSSTSQSGTISVGVSTGASTLADNLITGVGAYVSGARMDVVGFNTTLSPGDYWIARMFTSTSSTAGTRYGAGTMIQTHSRLLFMDFNFGLYRQLGKSVSNSTTDEVPWDGFLVTTTSLASDVVALSDMRATSGHVYWNFIQDTLS